MNNFYNNTAGTWTTTAPTNTMGYHYANTYPLQYYPPSPPSMVEWFRVPRPMSKPEAEAYFQVSLNSGPITNYFLQGGWADGTTLGPVLIHHHGLVRQVFPQGYNPNMDWIVPTLLPESKEDLSAETQVVKKTRALLKTKGQNDYTPDTAQMIDSFLSKIKQNERVRL